MQEVARSMYPVDDRPLLLNFFAGLGRSDVTMRQVEYMADARAKSVEVTKLMVDSWTCPLYEVENRVLKLTVKKPVEDYLKSQNKFRHLTDEQIQFIQSEVDEKRKMLLENACAHPTIVIKHLNA